LSQPFHVAEVFTGAPGKYVELKESVQSFQVYFLTTVIILKPQLETEFGLFVLLDFTFILIGKHWYLLPDVLFSPIIAK
jgi:hypothetical protein